LIGYNRKGRKDLRKGRKVQHNSFVLLSDFLVFLRGKKLNRKGRKDLRKERNGLNKQY
jgi:hypothetical protein